MKRTHTFLARIFSLGACLPILFLLGCTRSTSDLLQGYIEGEYVYVASPFAGMLEKLYVQRGTQVKAGDPLFALESVPEKAARDEAERRLTQARSNLEDLKKGKRPSEIESMEAQLKQAEAAMQLSEKEFLRQRKLLETPGATTQQDVDRASSVRDQDRERAAQLKADLATARLGARQDQIHSAEANVHALEASLTKAEWDLAQKRQSAPQAGIVFDTLYREGEWVAAGRPAVALLPPQNIKLRVFVPELRVGAIKLGDSVQVLVDGVKDPVPGKVSFISPKTEFTPPVIYNRENRSKLVVMVEALFEPAAAIRLHPGQPVDVRLAR